MRTIQEIFNAVLDGDDEYSQRKLMCWALQQAECSGIITEEECRFATEQIGEYLEDWIMLNHALHYSQSKVTPLEVYRDWANRPTLTHR